MKRHERDYVDRTIATVRQHHDADGSWPQWANALADEVEALREEIQELQEALLSASRGFAQYAEERNDVPDDTVREFAEGFRQDGHLRLVAQRRS